MLLLRIVHKELGVLLIELRIAVFSKNQSNNRYQKQCEQQPEKYLQITLFQFR